MKVKLFWKRNPLAPARWFSPSGGNARALEEEINTWLRFHQRIKVVEIKQSAHGSLPGVAVWMISIWYEEEGA